MAFVAYLLLIVVYCLIDVPLSLIVYCLSFSVDSSFLFLVDCGLMLVVCRLLVYRLVFIVYCS